MTAEEFIDLTVNYWKGYFEWTEDLPDGAWWASLENGFEFGLDDCCEALGVPKPENCDGNDLAHAYIAKITEEEGNAVSSDNPRRGL